MSDKIEFLIRKANEEQDHREVVRIASENRVDLNKNSLNLSIRSAYSMEDFETALDLSRRHQNHIRMSRCLFFSKQDHSTRWARRTRLSTYMSD